MSFNLKVVTFKGQPPKEPLTISFGPDGGTIGRSKKNSLVLPDPNRYISRQHAVISYENESYYLKDTSLAGSYIRNKQMLLHQNKIKLEDGDRIEIGDYELLVGLGKFVETQYSSDQIPILEDGNHHPDLSHKLSDNAGEKFSVERKGEKANKYGDFEAAVDFINKKMEEVVVKQYDETENGFPFPDEISEIPPDKIDEPFSDEISEPLPDDISEPPPDDIDEPLPDDISELLPDEVNESLPDEVNEPFPDDIDEPLSDDILELLPDVISEPLSDEVNEPFPDDISEPLPDEVNEPSPDEINESLPDDISEPLCDEINGTSPKEDGQVPLMDRSCEEDDAISDKNPSVSHLFQIFLEAAGIEDKKFYTDDEIPELMKTAGAVFRELVEGLAVLINGRAESKNQMRLAGTILGPVDNNPFKFSASMEEIFKLLLTNKQEGFISGIQAVRDSHADIIGHQLAMTVGIQAALKKALKRFDPAPYMERHQKGVFSLRKTKCWDAYCNDYNSIVIKTLENFLDDEFVRAYEAQIKRLNGSKSKS